MRDIAITAIIFGMLPFVIARPWIGVMLYVWISVMTPHQFAWGFAYSFPFAAIVAVCTMVGLLVTKDEVRYEPNALLWLLILLPAWMCVTTAFALERETASGHLVDVLKVFLFVHVSAMVLRTRKHIEWLLWVLVVSIGFFGIKGGLFTIINAGEHKVYGPPGESFMSDNNAISVALVMAIPLMQYLRSVASSRWVRHGLLLSMLLSGMAILGTYSRGALVAIAAMLLFLWLKSSRKLVFGALLVVLIPLALGVMPEQWSERMNSISNYEKDSSAMGRINSWTTAVNIANDRPLVGGGFDLYTLRTFARYAPDPLDVHSAHSVYFQMLGEHGYVGLLIFLLLCAFTWVAARQTIALSRRSDETAWAGSLARAIQVSLIGFSVGGAFVNISYWELPYYEIVIILIARKLVSPPKAAPGAITGDPQALRPRPHAHPLADR